MRRGWLGLIVALALGACGSNDGSSSPRPVAGQMADAGAPAGGDAGTAVLDGDAGIGPDPYPGGPYGY